MSSSNKRNRPETPFEMVSGCRYDEHPVDLMVSSRLPHAKLKERIRDAADEVMIALGDRRSLWMQLEHQLNQRNTERNEEFFNLGYEYGVAAGRAEAFGKLSDNADLETQKLAQRLRTLLVQDASLPASNIVTVLLETTWAFALDMKAADPADNEA